jgi:DNA-binding NarL/FixJ family response regulator
MNTSVLPVCVHGPRLLCSAVEALLDTMPGVRLSDDNSARVALLVGDRWGEMMETLPDRPLGLVLVGIGSAEELHSASKAGIHAFIHAEDGITELTQALAAAAVSEDFCSRTLLPALLEALRNTSAKDADVLAKPEPILLSARELEVARHAAEGLSNAEIAKRLSVSLATIKFHLGAVFRKLGLRGRAQLSALFSDASRPNLPSSTWVVTEPN